MSIGDIKLIHRPDKIDSPHGERTTATTKDQHWDSEVNYVGSVLLFTIQLKVP